MNTKARQWPFNLTAGLQPVQLVHYYQRGLLTLEFRIKHELHDGLIEPLMSPTVWKNGMEHVKQVAWEEHTWLISGLASVAVKYDKARQEIHGMVTFHEDAGQMSVTNRLIDQIFGEDLPNEIEAISYPQLEYTFSEGRTSHRCG